MAVFSFAIEVVSAWPDGPPLIWGFTQQSDQGMLALPGTSLISLTRRKSRLLYLPWPFGGRPRLPQVLAQANHVESHGQLFGVLEPLLPLANLKIGI